MSAQIPAAQVIKGGYRVQALLNSSSLGATTGSPITNAVQNDTDALGLNIKFDVVTVHGTSTYGSSASVLTTLSELLITASDKKRQFHDFRTWPGDLQNIAFMLSTINRRGGYFTPDVAISADGTNTVVVDLWSRIRASDFPLNLNVTLAALNATMYTDTTHTGTATLSVTVTPIKATSVGAFKSQYSYEWALSGLAATNNDVSQQLQTVSSVSEIGFTVGTESHLTDVTLQTPNIDMVSIPRLSLKQFDAETISGHQTGFFRIPLNGFKTNLDKNTTTMKFNESTADNPTVYVIGEM